MLAPVVLGNFIWPFLTSLGIAYLTTPLAIKLAQTAKLIDDPATHKHSKVVHTYPVPRGGGLPIIIALIISAIIWLPFDNHTWGILCGALLACLVGLIDDRYDISPYIRLAANVVSALCIVGVGIGIAFISNPLGGIIDLSHPRLTFEFLGSPHSIWLLADTFAIIWIVAIMNLVGQGAGGIEGQLPGVVVIASISIALLSLSYSADITQWSVIVIAGITAGSYLGFLPWNFFPQKIMPGYSGKSLAGFLLAVMAILSTAKVGVLLIVLGFPIADAVWSVIRRVAQGKSPFWGDRGHLHHKLLDAGWGKRQIVIFYWFISACLGIVALTLNSQQKFYTLIAIGLMVGILLLWLHPISGKAK
jgi:UDP-GlcNAc:undecaprenyl-phosphate GlcNAc-1-phosphate transferase